MKRLNAWSLRGMESACMILKRNTRNSCYGKHKFSNAKNTIDTKLFWWFEAKCRQPKWDGERRRVYCENKTESPTKLVGSERMRCTVKTFTAYGNFMWIVFFFVNVSLVAVRELLFVFPSLLLTVCRMSPMCWLRNPHWALQFDWIDAFNAAAQNPTYTSKSLASWWTNEYIYLPMLFDIFEYFFMPFFSTADPLWMYLNHYRCMFYFDLRLYLVEIIKREPYMSLGFPCLVFFCLFQKTYIFLAFFLVNYCIVTFSLAGIGCRLNFKYPPSQCFPGTKMNKFQSFETSSKSKNFGNHNSN